MNSPALLLITILVCIIFIIISSRRGLHPFLALFIAAIFFGLVVGLPLQEILQSITNGFGSLLGQIGFIVAFGTILGNALERTGAMEIISTSILKAVGPKRSVLALTLIGGVVGIPVFCDSGFIILSRMIPSLVAKSTASGGSLSIALASGLYTSHTLIPPTPGPLAAASNLNVALGSVIGTGLLISIPVLAVSFLFAAKVARDAKYELAKPTQGTTASMSIIAAWVPLLIPLLLIGVGSIVRPLQMPPAAFDVLMFITSPAIALLIGIIFCLALFRGPQLKGADWISASLRDAGLILMITGAGGAFGAVIKAGGIEKMISSFTSDASLAGLVLIITSWTMAAVLKTAQGSTTSAMIVSSSLMAPLIPTDSLSVLPLLLVFAIGGGAMTVSHANDSYFWVVSQFGGLSTKDMVRRFTLLTFVQGITVLLLVLMVYGVAAGI